jgi:hypothetical protein
MIKWMDVPREILTIVYLVLIFIGIGLFFRKGSLTYFVRMLQELYALDDVLA